ncbi:DEAD/DEAH box helicase [Methanomicrobiaceae archaeon CYW5]|uniref:type I restriction endonuclease subunit R n=1 Tax=Methanovulcanius yangii TaxID=1789227 RepID=UPI0029CA401E|nr:type I restriction endonuclease subunit R [Methanovulcanius yangii]MBT8506974.1 DEAD/DEAH box helicase [Methanovulcanius yangii]
MTPYKFTESEVEDAALQWFSDLGYDVVSGPEIAPGEPAAERDDYHQPFLLRRVRDSLYAINPMLTDDAIDEAVRKLTIPPSPALIENNHVFHQYLTDGIPVEYRENGDVRHGLVRVIDTSEPERNDWLVVNQYTMVEGDHNRRPDIVVFVNGIPVAVLELKNPADENATIWSAYTQLQTYKQQISSLFNTNEVLVISDGVQARAGSLTADEDRFMVWRTIDGDETASSVIPQLEVLLKGLFAKDRFLEYMSDFILFENTGSTLIKKIAAYHQFHAVKAAVESTITASAPEGDKKGGVIWHTQGSGKSLSMVFYARQIILRREMENPTLVFLTDQNDLDGQLFETFGRCHEHIRQTPIQAESRADLRELLTRESGGVIFSTIQKFFPEKEEEDHPLLSDRHNIVFIADEAHRSHYGFTPHVSETTGFIRYGFAEYIRQALPNASSIGFTGTPISLKDRDTKAVFGDYISIYDVIQANEDGVTVPIYYEGRHAKLELPDEEKPLLDSTFEEVTENEEEDVRNKLKTKWGQLEAVVGAEHRIDIIAEDIVNHFEKRLETLDGKAMIVCMSRRICVEMYDAITRLRPDWDSDDDMTGAIKVVMSGSASDKEEWQRHFRSKRQRDKVRARYVDVADPLKIVIVRDMWITGFDAPCMHTMYVDKPMQGHTLMQTIARVNRVFRDKPGGLIVDYLGIAPKLKEAIAEYTDENKKHKGLSVEEQEEAVSLMLEKYEICCDMLHGFDWSAWHTGDPGRRLSLIPAAMEHVLSQKDGKSRYLDAVTQLSTAFSLCVPHEETERIRTDVAFLQTVKASIAKTTSKTRKSQGELDHAVQQLVSEAITPEGIVDIFQAAGLKKPDISVLSDDFLAEVRELPQKNLAVELLRKLIDDEIKNRLRRNVVQSRKFSEMLEESVRKYQNRSVETAIIIEELIKTAQDVRDTVKRGEDLGLSDAEIAFYDALAENESARQVMEDEILRMIASELVVTIRNNVTIDWAAKESVRAKMRVMVKRILRKYGYPPDMQEQATKTVLEQAEKICGAVAI